MSCCDENVCRLIPCAPEDDLPHYYGQYSLQSGVTYENMQIVVPAPGGGTYTVPPGTIVINLPPGATSVTYQGCRSTINLPIPSGSSQSAIQLLVNQVMQQAAAQLAICNAPPNPHNPSGPGAPTSYGNEVQTVVCADGLAMNLIGSLPPGVTITLTELSIAAGIFQSTVSVAAANAAALSFIQGIKEAEVQCGYWNTEQSFTCPDTSVETIPANTYFSTESQEDADAQALAAAEAACPADGPDWTQLLWGVPVLYNEGAGSPATFTPDSLASDTFDTSCFIPAGQSFVADASFADQQTYPMSCAVLDYNGTGANCKLTTTTTSEAAIPGNDAHVVYVYMYSAGVFDSFVAALNMRDFPNDIHEWNFSIPDTGGITKQIVIMVQNDVAESGVTLNPAYGMTIHGVFENA